VEIRTCAVQNLVISVDHQKIPKFLGKSPCQTLRTPLEISHVTDDGDAKGKRPEAVRRGNPKHKNRREAPGRQGKTRTARDGQTRVEPVWIELSDPRGGAASAAGQLAVGAKRFAMGSRFRN
jgi:hypothetical protein